MLKPAPLKLSPPANIEEEPKFYFEISAGFLTEEPRGMPGGLGPLLEFRPEEHLV